MKNHPCPCCSCAHQRPIQSSFPNFNRRDFILSVSALTVGGLVGSGTNIEAAPYAPRAGRRPIEQRVLRVLPVLTYSVPQRREATSWRDWGAIQTEESALKEKQRIEQELSRMIETADFRAEVLPAAMVRKMDQVASLRNTPHDVLLIYAAGGGTQLVEAVAQAGHWPIMFLRHDPGPVYLWYEIAHPRFLRKTVDDYSPGMDVHDVVVDSQTELQWRLRALYGLKNTLNKRILAVGGASGWGEGGRQAPALAREQWKMELVDYPYSELGPRIKQARQDSTLVKQCQANARNYLRQSGVSLHTTRLFVENAFVLREVLNDVMDEAGTDAMTINSCMGTIMPMSETTACLPLSLLNDDGYLAFCESDFVVIPSGVLLHYISGKPVFLNDPTYPHDHVVTLAHCTAPRRMDGRRNERTKVLTHFESDYGAAPKVEMRLGQQTTNLVPDFGNRKWVGFDGTIIGNPFLDICRSQVDVRINGDCTALLEEMKGFHWMMSYGDYLKETGYALKKIGVAFHNVSAKKTA